MSICILVDVRALPPSPHRLLQQDHIEALQRERDEAKELGTLAPVLASRVAGM